MKKLLYSPGYGAGWSTWNDGQVGRYMVTYQPIIDFIEAGGSFSRDEVSYDTSNGALSTGNMHPLLVELARECKERFGKESYAIADEVEWL